MWQECLLSRDRVQGHESAGPLVLRGEREAARGTNVISSGGVLAVLSRLLPLCWAGTSGKSLHPPPPRQVTGLLCAAMRAHQLFGVSMPLSQSAGCHGDEVTVEGSEQREEVN